MLILNSPNCDQHNVHDLQVKIYPQSKPHKNIPKTKKWTWVKLLDQKRLWCQVKKCHKDREMNCWPSQAADYLWSKRRQASPDGSRGPLEGEQSGERGENGRDSGLKCSTSSPHYPSSQKYGETNSRRKKIEQLYFNLRISKGIKFVFSPSPIWCLWEIKCLTMYLWRLWQGGGGKVSWHLICPLFTCLPV